MTKSERILGIFEQHFAVMVLTIIFFGGAFLLAHYGLYEEMSRWIEGGPTVIALVAILKNQERVPDDQPATANVIEPKPKE